MQSSVHGGSNFWAKIEADLEKLADPKNELPPEKRKKLLTQIKTLADRWRPFVVEALSVVDAGRHN
jgi:hypothetical protein